MSGNRDSTIKNGQGGIKRLCRDIGDAGHVHIPQTLQWMYWIYYSKWRLVLLKINRKVLPRVSCVLAHHRALYNDYYCASSVRFALTFFFFCLISGIDFIFLLYCIQNLLKSDSLKINPELRQMCTDILQNGYCWVVTWKLLLCPWKSFRLLKPVILEPAQNFPPFPPTALGEVQEWAQNVDE